ncbi:hypothetical protein NNO07_03805 [Pseudomonas resinovorans]|uniref:DUF2637 domain-containing protein n=1 Tax=Metapseudomonas resinovorans TaxID=53412 RepID=A0ABT4Y022_METRE|nr:hypothetical protein [Pseudomonas resinovorans]MDA8482180.1 hypothetical protein [Pseudomonas resinovorans]
MQYITALSDGILALACLASAFALVRAGKAFADDEWPTWFCALPPADPLMAWLLLHLYGTKPNANKVKAL